MTRPKSYVPPKATSRDCCASLDLPHAEHTPTCRRLQAINGKNHPNRPVGRALNKKGNAAVIYVRASNSTIDSIDMLAVKYDVTRSTVARAAMRYALKNLEDFEEMLSEEPY